MTTMIYKGDKRLAKYRGDQTAKHCSGCKARNVNVNVKTVQMQTDEGVHVVARHPECGYVGAFLVEV